ncbi:MAG: hypothetical protein JXA30_20370 [Deltaproteobacteria bacterium]|nr:hypothetical protein [Deltaproteobacteria bacterium]
MNTDLWLLLGLTIVGGGWFVVHIVLLMRIVKSKRFPPLTRVAALIPIATPVMVWMTGRRSLVLFWIFTGSLYFALWFSR